MNWKKWLIGEWNWKRPFKSIAFIYACLFVIALFFAESFIFQPPPPGYADSPAILKLTSSTGDQIAAIELPARPGFPTLLYSHGNAEDLGSVSLTTQDWAEQGFGVLAYDFPGYGHSSGKPTEASCQAAIQAAWDHLTCTRKLQANRILIIGRSVGSGPSVWLASQTQPTGLILLSPFTSTFAVRIPIPILPRDRFPNLKRITSVRCPIRLLHGTADTTILPSHSQRLFALASVSNKSLHLIQDADHDNLLELGDTTLKSILQSFAAPSPASP